MGRPTKYVPGPVIVSLDDFAKWVGAGRYIIITSTGQRVHPGWAQSWQFRMVADAIRRCEIRAALHNPDYQKPKEISP